MPRGDKASYSSKQKRQTAHIEEGYEKKGIPVKEAKKRAWATVNKTTGGAKKPKNTSATKTSEAKKGSKSTAEGAKKRSTTSRSPAAQKAAATRKKNQKTSVRSAATLVKPKTSTKNTSVAKNSGVKKGSKSTAQGNKKRSAAPRSAAAHKAAVTRKKNQKPDLRSALAPAKSRTGSKRTPANKTSTKRSTGKIRASAKNVAAIPKRDHRAKARKTKK